MVTIDPHKLPIGFLFNAFEKVDTLGIKKSLFRLFSDRLTPAPKIVTFLYEVFLFYGGNSNPEFCSAKLHNLFLVDNNLTIKMRIVILRVGVWLDFRLRRDGSGIDFTSLGLSSEWGSRGKDWLAGASLSSEGAPCKWD